MTLPELHTAISAYAAERGHQLLADAAQAVSPIPAVVACLEVLGPLAGSLDAGGLTILRRACALVSEYDWHGQRALAGTVAATLPPSPPPPMPAIPRPV